MNHGEERERESYKERADKPPRVRADKPPTSRASRKRSHQGPSRGSSPRATSPRATCEQVDGSEDATSSKRKSPRSDGGNVGGRI
jgi:hypothetical protein